MVFLLTLSIKNAPAHIDDDDLVDRDGNTLQTTRMLCATEKIADRMIVETIQELFFAKPTRVQKTVEWYTSYHWQHPTYPNAELTGSGGEIEHVNLSEGVEIVNLPN